MSKSIVVEIVGDASDFANTLDKATGTTRKFGAAAKVAAGVVGGALLLGLEKSVSAAMDAQDSHRRLEQAFKNVGLSADTYAGQIDTAEEASRNLGFTGNETRDALGSLLTATGNVKTSMDDLAVAQDLARFKGVDLETATRTLTGAMTGSQRAVKQLGIAITPVTTNVDQLKAKYEELGTAIPKSELAQAKLLDKMATGQAVINATSELVKGQGQAYADTAAGGMAKFHAELDNLEVVIGSTLLPALTKLLNGATDIANYLTEHLGPTVSSVKETLGQFKGEAQAVATVLKVTLKVAVEIVKGVLELFELTLKADKKAFDLLESAARTVASFLQGAFHVAVTAAKTVASAFDTALDGVKGALNAVKNAATTVANYLGAGFKTAFNAAKSIIDAVKGVANGLAAALRAIARAARSAASAIRSIPSLPSGDVPGLPHVPPIKDWRASGGPVSAGMPYIVGEKGPEMFVPDTAGSIVPGRFGSSAGGNVFHFSFPNYVGTKQELADLIQREFLRTNKRNTTLGFT